MTTSEAKKPGSKAGLGCLAVVLVLFGLLYLVSYLRPRPSDNIGKGAYNALTKEKRGTIEGVEERFGTTVYQIRTDSGSISYAPVEGTEVR